MCSVIYSFFRGHKQLKVVTSLFDSHNNQRYRSPKAAVGFLHCDTSKQEWHKRILREGQSSQRSHSQCGTMQPLLVLCKGTSNTTLNRLNQSSVCIYEHKGLLLYSHIISQEPIWFNVIQMYMFWISEFFLYLLWKDKKITWFVINIKIYVTANVHYLLLVSYLLFLIVLSHVFFLLIKYYNAVTIFLATLQHFYNMLPATIWLIIHSY